MSYLVDVTTGNRIDAKGLQELCDELARARDKHPGTLHLLAALVEEVGELATAYLDHEGVDRVKAEAIQVACVAMRIYAEGDGEFEERQK